MKRILVVILLALTLSSCGNIGGSLLKGAASAAIGGSDIIPDVASVQVGKTNSKTVGTSENLDVVIKDNMNSNIRPIIRPEGVNTSGPVETITQNNTNIPPWMVIFFVVWSIVLWQLPSPKTMANGVKSGYQKLFKIKEIK